MLCRRSKSWSNLPRAPLAVYSSPGSRTVGADPSRRGGHHRSSPRLGRTLCIRRDRRINVAPLRECRQKLRSRGLAVRGLLVLRNRRDRRPRPVGMGLLLMLGRGFLLRPGGPSCIFRIHSSREFLVGERDMVNRLASGCPPALKPELDHPRPPESIPPARLSRLLRDGGYHVASFDAENDVETPLPQKGGV